MMRHDEHVGVQCLATRDQQALSRLFDVTGQQCAPACGFGE